MTIPPAPTRPEVFQTPESLAAALQIQTPPVHPRTLPKWNTLSLLQQYTAEDKYLLKKEKYDKGAVDCTGKKVTWSFLVSSVAKATGRKGSTVTGTSKEGHVISAFCPPSFKAQLGTLSAGSSATITGVIKGHKFGTIGGSKRFTFSVDVQTLKAGPTK